MGIYQLVWILLVAGLMLQYNGKYKYGNQLFIVVSIIMIAMVGFRGDEIGGDTQSYRHLYSHPKDADFGSTEIILPFINSVLRATGFSVYLASIIKAIMMILPVILLINRVCQNKCFALFLFATFSFGGSIFLLEFAAERQCLAISFFCIFLIMYVKNDYRLTKYMLIPLCLMFFTHNSSILAIPIILLTLIRLSKLYIVLFTVVSLVSGFFIGDYVNMLMLVADSGDKSFYLSNFGNASTDLLQLLPFFGSFFITLYYWPKENTDNIWFAGMFLTTISTGFLQTIGMNIERMSAYYYICAFFAIPKVLEFIPHKKIRVSYLLLIVIYFSYKYFRVLDIMTEVELGPCPYKTYF